jgi:GNAT superfamily N-acetyltransferase
MQNQDRIVTSNISSIELPRIYYKFNDNDSMFMKWLNMEHISIDEFYNNLKLKTVETIINKKRLIELSVTCNYINNYSIGFLHFSQFENPTAEIIFRQFDITKLKENQIKFINNTLLHFQYFVSISGVYVKPIFRRIGLMNFFVKYLTKRYENFNSLLLLQFESFGVDKISDAVLKRFYQSYGFYHDEDWSEIMRTLDDKEFDRTLILKNKIY